MKAARETARDPTLFALFIFHSYFFFRRLLFFIIDKFISVDVSIKSDRIFPFSLDSIISLLLLYTHDHSFIFSWATFTCLECRRIAEEFNTARFWRIRECGVARDLFFFFFFITYNLIVEKRLSINKTELR